jgi:hypothetical protein
MNLCFYGDAGISKMMQFDMRQVEIITVFQFLSYKETLVYPFGRQVWHLLKCEPGN